MLNTYIPVCVARRASPEQGYKFRGIGANLTPVFTGSNLPPILKRLYAARSVDLFVFTFDWFLHFRIRVGSKIEFDQSLSSIHSSLNTELWCAINIVQVFYVPFLEVVFNNQFRSFISCRYLLVHAFITILIYSCYLYWMDCHQSSVPIPINHSFWKLMCWFQWEWVWFNSNYWKLTSTYRIAFSINIDVDWILICILFLYLLESK